MNWKGLLKTVMHTAVGAATATMAATVAGGSPITSGAVLLPALGSAASSAFSALNDPANTSPSLHAAIGLALPMLLGIFGAHVGVADPHLIAAALLSAASSAGSHQFAPTMSTTN